MPIIFFTRSTISGVAVMTSLAKESSSSPVAGSISSLSLFRLRQQSRVVDSLVESIANDLHPVGGNAWREDDRTAEFIGGQHHFG